MARTILILAANPKNTPQLRLDQEVREIDNGLERAQKRDEFILKQKLAARPVDVRRAMLDYKPNIVHFCGHGSGEEGIAFEDENGQAKLVSTEALAGFFELFADKVECVVLNACYSEVQAEAIAKYISYVIGMNKAIGDAAAIEFAVAFYDALGVGESIEFAHKLACNAIQWAGIPEHLTPALKLKAQTTQVDRAHGDVARHSLVGDMRGDKDQDRSIEDSDRLEDIVSSSFYARDVEKRIARFVCNSQQAMNAEEVYVAGTFNDWLNAREGTIEPHEFFRLDKVTKEGVVVWEKEMLIPIGPHDFKFVVGHNFWIHWYEQSDYPKGSDAPGGNNFHIDVA